MKYEYRVIKDAESGHGYSCAAKVMSKHYSADEAHEAMDKLKEDVQNSWSRFYVIVVRVGK